MQITSTQLPNKATTIKNEGYTVLRPEMTPAWSSWYSCAFINKQAGQSASCRTQSGDFPQKLSAKGHSYSTKYYLELTFKYIRVSNIAHVWMLIAKAGDPRLT